MLYIFFLVKNACENKILMNANIEREIVIVSALISYKKVNCEMIMNATYHVKAIDTAGARMPFLCTLVSMQ